MTSLEKAVDQGLLSFQNGIIIYCENIWTEDAETYSIPLSETRMQDSTSGTEVKTLLSYSSQLSMKFKLLMKSYMQKSIFLKLFHVVYIMLIMLKCQLPMAF